jgi:hypothetical protein
MRRFEARENPFVYTTAPAPVCKQQFGIVLSDNQSGGTIPMPPRNNNSRSEQGSSFAKVAQIFYGKSHPRMRGAP